MADPNNNIPTSPDNSSTTPRLDSSSQLTKSTIESAERFPVWMALCVFSCICIASVLSSNNPVDSAGEHWILAVATISLLVSFAAVASYLCFRSLVVSQVPETAMIALVLGLWAAGMPTIMNPGNHIAVSESTVDPELYAPTVLNANLYFFSWLSFAACVGISSSLYREYIDYNPIYSAKIGRWYGLAASSLVVMGSASRALQNTNCDSVDFCRRTKFTIAVGVLGCLLSVLMVYLTQKALTIRAETTITSFNLILFCFGVGYTTFGESPGSTIGNLYFSIWISFILSVVNFASCFRQYVSQSMETSTHQGSEAPAYDDTI